MAPPHESAQAGSLPAGGFATGAPVVGIRRRSVLALGVKVISAASVFALSALVSRTMPAEGAATFFLALTLGTVLAAVGRMGLDRNVIRFVGSTVPPRHAGAVVMWTLVLAAVATAVISVGVSQLIAFTGWGAPEMVAGARLSVPIATSIAVCTVASFILQGYGRASLSLIVATGGSALGALCIGLLAWWSGAVELDAGLVAVAFAASGAITLAVSLGVLLARDGVRLGLVRVDWRPIWASCRSMFWIVLMAQAFRWSGQIALGAGAGAEDVVAFNAAQRTANLVSFLLVAVNAVVAPAFVGLIETGDRQRLQQMVSQSTRLMTAACLPVLVLLLIFQDRVMAVFGPAAAVHGMLLAMLVVAQGVNVATGNAAALLIVSGHEATLRNVVVVTGVVSASLCFALADHGVYAVGMVTAVAIALQNILVAGQVRRRLGVSIW